MGLIVSIISGLVKLGIHTTIGLGLYSCYVRPSDESFHLYIRDQIEKTSTNNIYDWCRKQQVSINMRKEITDYLVFKIGSVTYDNRTAHFIGIFHTWFPIQDNN